MACGCNKPRGPAPLMRTNPNGERRRMARSADVEAEASKLKAARPEPERVKLMDETPARPPIRRIQPR